MSIPVIASGGFADARGFIAALALGAEGVNMGTRMIATQESPVHPKVKERLVEASERDTILMMRPVRNIRQVLRNSVAEKVAEMERRGATIEELAPLVSRVKGRELFQTGDLERGLLSSGQVVGLIRHIPMVKELVQTIIGEAEEIIKYRLGSLT